MSSETALRAAAKVYLGVVAALGERVPGESFNYFEASLSNAEAYNRWLALNEAGKVLKAAIEASATPPRAAKESVMDAELKPCPFCGGDATLEQIERPYGLQWSVGCRDEDCVGYQSLTAYGRKAEASAAWNRRHPPAPAAGGEACPYCTSNNEAVRATYFDQTCAGCVARMAQPSPPQAEEE